MIPKKATTVGTGTQGLRAAGLNWDEMHYRYKTDRVKSWLDSKCMNLVPPPPKERLSPAVLREERDQRRRLREEMQEKQQNRVEQLTRDARKAQNERVAQTKLQETQRISAIREEQSYSKQKHNQAIADFKDSRTLALEAVRNSQNIFKQTELQEKQRLLDRKQQPHPRSPKKSDLIVGMLSERRAVVETARKRRRRRDQERSDLTKNIRFERSEEIKKDRQLRGEKVQRMREEKEMFVISQRAMLREDFMHSAKDILADRTTREQQLCEATKQSRLNRLNRPETANLPRHLSPMNDVRTPSRQPKPLY